MVMVRELMLEGGKRGNTGRMLFDCYVMSCLALLAEAAREMMGDDDKGDEGEEYEDAETGG